ncbi:hypothetical protein L198_03677 [Cryptococcus wingfieldii CBS 7118]|uniref:Uncharacterized protein n=1 Tax=Cryptococcus wingfieldii CBS 7118 TaxID=1295528 RepID=A0A1E3JC31_9TREE|nr:hypothetical protein L198_03677 [Cryptococcus wingfieldii CBS 7118]ODN98433.1 hypothetical protein L198_03677 [Cryptococcus wingfieldii CBS 7118]
MRLPPELMLLVAKQLQSQHAFGTLSSLLRTSSGIYDLFAPLLYRNLFIMTDNAHKIFVGLEPHNFGEVIIEEKDEQKERELRDEIRDEWTLWPSVPIKLPSDLAPLPSLTSSTYIPSPATHRRKLALLAHTRSLTLLSLPTPPESKILLPLFPARSPVPLPLMPNLAQVTVENEFIAQAGDHLSRHWAGPHRASTPVPRHPFIDFLLLSTPPRLDALTFHFPLLTSALKQAFIDLREGPEDVVKRCTVGGTRHRRMQHEWSLFKEEILGMGLMPLTFHWKGERVYMDGVTCSAVPMPRKGVVTIKYDPCSCRCEDKVEGEPARDCANHVDAKKRAGQILETIKPTYDAVFAASADDIEQWAFIDVEDVEGGGGDDGVESQVRRTLGDIERASRVAFSSLKEKTKSE